MNDLQSAAEINQVNDRKRDDDSNKSETEYVTDIVPRHALPSFGR